MQHHFQRVAIVNRGEAAMRFIHAAREFNDENAASLRTIALFTEPDAHAMFVREADEAVSLGAAHVIDATTGQSKCSYVDYECLRDALIKARADAVWVGWGFVAEHADFVDLCNQLGIVFIGPDVSAMRRLGDKISSKRLAEQLKIPTVRWIGPVDTASVARRFGEVLGYPLLIKATAGGGGHGIRLVRSTGEISDAFESARAEAFKAFGNPTVFLEELIPRARHVEVQVIGDHYGTTWAVGVRDCTIQRRHQKILEEAPSPVLSPELDRSLRLASVRLCEGVGYYNAGTVEFLYDPITRQFFFMEMNTRLQVEHPVTECTTHLDLVKLQIHVARGGRLEGDPPAAVGHAIEVRLNAEDPDAGFAPAPGIVERFRVLAGPGVRVDTGISEGDQVPAQFDSMIAKIIAYGRTRNEALARLRRTLRESVVVVRGGASNKAFLLDLLSRPEVEKGEGHNGWLDHLASAGNHLARGFSDVALLQAAIEAYDDEHALETLRFYASALRGRPQVRDEVGRTVSLRYRGLPYTPTVCRLSPRQYRIEIDGSSMDVYVDRLGKFESWLTIGDRRFNITSVAQELNYRIEVDGVAHRVDRDGGGFVHAPAPAVVVANLVKAGDVVSTGDRLVVLESMKMEMQVVAPFSGTVRRVLAIPNVQVDTATPLIQLDSDVREEDATSNSSRVTFGASFSKDKKIGASRCVAYLEELRQVMLGFDVDPKRTAKLLTEWNAHRDSLRDAEEISRCENEILHIFVDIGSLFRRQPYGTGAIRAEAPSAEAQLFTYLHALNSKGEGLPATFVEALKKALAHYGVHTLDRTPELEDSLFWIYKSHQRVEQQVAPVLAVLEDRLQAIHSIPVPERDSFGTLLDRMITISNGVHPAISDLARELRYRLVEQPMFEHARKLVYAEIENHLVYMGGHPDAVDRRDRVSSLIDCPQPLLGLFARYFATAEPHLREFMLEVLTARYYRFHNLTDLHSVVLDQQSFVAAQYEDEGRPVHLFTAQAEYRGIATAVESLIPLIRGIAEEEDVAVDLYIWHSDQPRNPDTTQQEIRDLLNATTLPRPIQRIVIAAGCSGCEQGIANIQHFTFVPGENGYQEEKLYRGVHPMMGKRLHLWRLTNFHIERLPSVEDVYLFHAIARDNPKDQRLFAGAEVRDVTAVRNEDGHIVRLPHLERMFSEAVAAIRLWQSRRRPNERLYWNRILLFLWPPLGLKKDELESIVQRLVPSTEGLGLEQVVVCARVPHPKTAELRDMVVRISSPAGKGLVVTIRPATLQQPLKPLSEYEQKVVRMRQRGMIYPYEIIKMLTPARDDMRAEFPPGEFTEYDLNAAGDAVPVTRPHGQNKTNIILGLIRTFTPRYPEGMKRVVLLGDPSRDLGALAEAECRRIIAGIDLAEANKLPLEWFPISAGAKISMESGVENMDWIAHVLRRIVTFTQAGGEINLVVNGINVGAQPYWNAEATMLMHTRGILIMTPAAAMVLTGKRALDYSGSVSSEDNQGIGGYDRIMGVNGQAQYWARDIEDACHILLRHYDHTYIAPGERFPRRAPTTDSIDRDVRASVHGKDGEDGFATIGEILSDETNPGRKKPFDIRKVMKAAIDQDHEPLERWAGMRAADTAVVWDAHFGGYPVCLIGFESRPLQRFGFVPGDGPDLWSAGTLFPQSSKKVARAINAASNNRPLVILANLSGFDGSPESMRRLQLEYGAEIGRAVINFKGPMVFCVISRYHGGAYVVFSRVLNEALEVAALEGTYASVIGGAPAAAVVFAGEVDARTRKDERVQALNKAMAEAEGAAKVRLRAQYNETLKLVQSEKLGEIAAEFDRIHSVQRALSVGALHRIIPPAELRPFLIHALERGIAAELKLERLKGNGESREQPAGAVATMVA